MSDPRATLRAVATADRSARNLLAVSLGASLVAALALLVGLVLLARTVDRAFLDGADVAELAPWFAAMVVALVVRAGALGIADIGAAGASGRLRSSIRTRALRSLVLRTGSSTPDSHSGALVTDVGDGVDSLDPYVTQFVPAAVLAGIVPAVVFVAVLVLDPLSSLVLLFAGPMLILLLAVIGRRTRDLTEQRVEELAWLNSFFLDLLRGMATLAAFDRSGDAGDRIEEVSRRHGATTMEVLRTAFQTSLVMEWAATAATALVAVLVSFRLVGGHVTYGVALSVLILVPEFFAPLRRLALEYHAGQAGNAAWDRLAPLLDSPAARAATVTTVAADDTPAVAAVAPIEFSHVSVRRRGDQLTLDGVDLRIESGESIALVGPSGAGKTTLTELLLRFVEPSGGGITVAGTPLADLVSDDWRTRLAWVPQSPTIFSGTVADNVRLGDPSADDDRVRQALAAARATEFVDALPRGVATVLGEGGLQLSGGQRQRLAIARAWLRDAELVILDEFTAHLDTGTERAVLDATRDLLHGRTAILIAHRLATARLADRIVVLDAGRIVGDGTNDSLLADCPTYRALVAHHRSGPFDERRGTSGATS